ncbi:MAG: hypothetical protein ACERKN_21680 [Velocimicrobium sp.]
MANQFELDGYIFQNQTDYKKAKKELEAITYIKSNSDLTNARLILKIYNKLLDKGTFQTVIGYVFLKELQQKIREDNSISKEKIRSVKIKDVEKIVVKEKEINRFEEAKRAETYQALYEKERTKKISTKIVIIFLTCIIIGMFLVAQLTPYSIFTNYEDKIVNKYENWQQELEQKEADLDKREAALIEKE